MYDLIIIGAGPAGLTSAIYASCYKIKHALIAKNLGGQASLATHILNYPGFDQKSGKMLIEKMVNQARTLGSQIIETEVVKIGKKEDGFELTTLTGQTYQTKTIILATGMERRKLNVPGEKEYTNKGVYYCATCEPSVFSGKDVGVVGAGNSAFQAANQLIGKANSVNIFVRSEILRADPIWVDPIMKNPKAKIFLSTKVLEIKGNDWVNEVVIEEKGVRKNQALSALFIEVGGMQGSALVLPLGVKITKDGYIEVDKVLQTAVAGIFSAGDVILDNLAVEQIATSVGSGARGAASVFQYLNKEKVPTVWGTTKITRTKI
jgi:thioredoxin reductase